MSPFYPPFYPKDEPGWETRDYFGRGSSKPSLIEQEFETCAVCADGCYRGKKILSYFRWGHRWKHMKDMIGAKQQEVGAEYDIHRWATIGTRTGRSGPILINRRNEGPGYNILDPAYKFSSPGHGPSSMLGGRLERPCSAAVK